MLKDYNYVDVLQEAIQVSLDTRATVLFATDPRDQQALLDQFLTEAEDALTRNDLDAILFASTKLKEIAYVVCDAVDPMLERLYNALPE